MDEALSDLQPHDVADFDCPDDLGDEVEHDLRSQQPTPRTGRRWRYRSGTGARDDAVQFCLQNL